jgi:hypothetical protein
MHGPRMGWCMTSLIPPLGKRTRPACGAIPILYDCFSIKDGYRSALHESQMSLRPRQKPVPEGKLSMQEVQGMLTASKYQAQPSMTVAEMIVHLQKIGYVVTEPPTRAQAAKTSYYSSTPPPYSAGYDT